MDMSAAAWEGRSGGGCQCCRWQCRGPGWSRFGGQAGPSLCLATTLGPPELECVLPRDVSATTRVALPYGRETTGVTAYCNVLQGYS